MTVPEITPEFRPLRHRDSAFRPVADEGGLVVLPDRAEVKVLNPSAITIFGLLDGEHTVQQIADELATTYDVQVPQALTDVQSFVKELSEHGMLAESSPGQEG